MLNINKTDFIHFCDFVFFLEVKIRILDCDEKWWGILMSVKPKWLLGDIKIVSCL